MRKTLAAQLAVVTLFMCQSAFAYNIPSHFDMSSGAVIRSILNTDPGALPNLGLRNLDQQFPATAGEDSRDFSDGCVHGGRFSITNLVACGAEFEDVPGTRSFNHFFDPVNNAPLTVRFPPFIGPYVKPGTLLGVPNLISPDWALQDNNVTAEQAFAYRNARNFFYQALTTTGAQQGRDDFWGKLFQSLGQVIHHLQDMAQPQHVRNDQHVDRPVPGYYNPSLYEDFTSDPANRLGVQAFIAGPGSEAVYTAANPGPFKLPRDFWTNASATGIAEFTNQNFVSAGTNFEVFRGQQVATTRYTNPRPGTPTDVQIQSLNPPVSQDILTYCGASPVCQMSFYSTNDNTATYNQFASALSIFDQYVQLRPAQYEDPPFNSYQLDRIFTLNRYTFASAYPQLIPRAVGYSAGLINYFFRGKMEVSLPDEGVYAIVDHSQVQVTDPAAGFAGFDKIKLKLANTTPSGEAMSGGTLQTILKFRRNLLFTDDLSKMPDQVDAFSARSTVEEIVFSDVKSGVSVGTAPQPFTFTFAQALPLNATDVSLQVVYRGVLGQEQDAVAVTTKNISEPTYYTYHNFSDYISVGGQPYTRDEVNADGALLAQIQPQSCIDPQTGKLQSYCFQPFTISMDLNFGAGGAYRLATMNGLNVRQFLRLAWLGDADANTLLSNTGPCMPQDDSVKPANWQLSYDASGAATLYYPLFKQLRGVWGWYQTSCVWSGDNVPSADNWADRLVPLNPVPAPTTLQMNFQ